MLRHVVLVTQPSYSEWFRIVVVVRFAFSVTADFAWLLMQFARSDGVSDGLMRSRLDRIVSPPTSIAFQATRWMECSPCSLALVSAGSAPIAAALPHRQSDDDQRSALRTADFIADFCRQMTRFSVAWTELMPLNETERLAFYPSSDAMIARRDTSRLPAPAFAKSADCCRGHQG